MEIKLAIVILYEYPNSKRRIVSTLTPDFSDTSFCVSLEAMRYSLKRLPKAAINFTYRFLVYVIQFVHVEKVHKLSVMGK